jgi:hypothetical protein
VDVDDGGELADVFDERPERRDERRQEPAPGLAFELAGPALGGGVQAGDELSGARAGPSRRGGKGTPPAA